MLQKLNISISVLVFLEQGCTVCLVFHNKGIWVSVLREWDAYILGQHVIAFGRDCVVKDRLPSSLVDRHCKS